MGEFVEDRQDIYCFQTYRMDKDEKLDSMTYGMISNNKIYGLLECTYLQIDAERMLRYNITTCVPFQEYIRRELTKKQLLELCASLLKMMMEAGSYMIDSSSVILEREYLYVDSASQKIRAIVLPLEKERKATDLHMFFKELFFDIHLDQSEDTSYFAQLIHGLGTGFQLSSFLKLVEQLQHETKEAVVRKKTDKPAIPKQPVILEEKQKRNTLYTEQPKVLSKVDKAKPKQEEEKVSVAHAKAEKGFFKSLFKKEGKQKKKEAKVRKAEEKLGFLLPGQSTAEDDVASSIPIPDGISTTKSGRIISGTSTENIPHYAADFGNTVVLGDEENATVLLDEGNDTVLLDDEAKEMYLIRNRNLERIDLINRRTSFGRAGDNDVVITGNDAVSSHHAYIEVDGSSCFLIDRHSKNHTFLNNSQLDAQARYELHDGDEIKMANETFQFNCRFVM